jgi:signal transduction histidine kinase
MKLVLTQLLNRSLNERQLTWFIRTLCLISLVLIISLSYSYHTINKELLYYSNRVDTTHQALLTLQQLSSKVYQTSHLRRNYLFLQDSHNKRYLKKSADIDSIVLKLDSVFENSSPQKKRVNLIRIELVDFQQRTRLLLSESITTMDSTEKIAFLKGDGMNVERIDKLIQDISNIETKLSHTRTQSRDNYKTQVFSYNWAIMLIAIIFLVSSFTLLDLEVNRNKRYRIELENRIEELDRSTSELEQFAYVASHDLQEPLRKIRSFSDRLSLKFKEDLPPEAKEIIQKLSDASKRMQLLINDLLSFSRLIKKDTEMVSVDLDKVLRDVRMNLSVAIKGNRVIIQSEPLPTVNGYEFQLTQLFQNLISNSIKYRHMELDPRIEITYSLSKDKKLAGIPSYQQNRDFHRITFSDNGIGFSPEYAEKIFVIFQRLHAKEEYDGTGIGLAICRRVVSNHNGYITAEGKEGSGAKFSVYLPVH